MSDRLVIDLFAEDSAHEAFLRPLIERIAREEGRGVRVRTISARGGHGRAVSEFVTYQRSDVRRVAGEVGDLVVVAIDANCAKLAAKRKEIAQAASDAIRDRCVAACPDPHIERWYLADLSAFHAVVGTMPSVPADKCERDLYKRVLAQAVVSGGHPATLGGIDFAREIADAMDLHRAGQSVSSLGHFIRALRGRLRLA